MWIETRHQESGQKCACGAIVSSTRGILDPESLYMWASIRMVMIMIFLGGRSRISMPFRTIIVASELG